ncbi:hypothetical protein [Natranaerobius trueperi]|uniref:Uncharacterized protein n=1 Tax=Natranaerobius trueperi TaxID=759412 RepID=A0A226BUJ1_9FIRM|nr:hypothetical protein [Natranaerobius trueperi]OWZ82643.1 hypothetical protein CDO51_13000 [Natranaerobius trueperi]
MLEFFWVTENKGTPTKSYKQFQDWLQNTWEGNWQTDEWDFFKGQTNLTKMANEWLISENKACLWILFKIKIK